MPLVVSLAVFTTWMPDFAANRHFDLATLRHGLNALTNRFASACCILLHVDSQAQGLRRR